MAAAAVMRPTSAKSALKGFVDQAYNAVQWAVKPRHMRWFSDGYGDLDAYKRAADEAMASWRADGMASLSAPLDITWTEHPMGVDLDDIWSDEGTFTSPLAESLPEASKITRFLFVRAAPQSKLPPTRGVIVMMAETGSVDYVAREAQLARPLLAHGIASMIVMAPFNGVRSPEGQTEHYVSNVADYMWQSLAIIQEGTALLRHLSRGFEARPGERHSVPLGVSGLSWGGAMASCTALSSRLPVACMVGLGSDSPKVMVTGTISWQLDWAALGKLNGAQDREEVAATLMDIFTRLTFATLLEAAPAPAATIGSVVQVAAAHDGYVIPEECEQLQASLVKAVVPGAHSSLSWVDGGHATAFVGQTAIFVPAIVQAMDLAAPRWPKEDTSVLEARSE